MIYGVYAAKHNDSKVRRASQSGGAFTAVSDWILDRGGVIYGCILDDRFRAVHIRAENKEQRDRMRGSKYVQSALGNVFRMIRDDLAAGKKVMFTGTPCQVAGLKRFIGDKGDQLYCIDIICHGVPSPAVWAAYLDWQKKRARSEIESANFRDKSFGWHSCFETINFRNGTKVTSSVYANLFYAHQTVRPSCFRCAYKNIERQGDLTIADCWGIEKADPELDDNKGLSLILVNSEKGKELFSDISADMTCKPEDIEDLMQPCLREQFPVPEDRDLFWQEFRKKSFVYIARKYADYGLGNKVRHFMKRVAYKLRKESGKIWKR